LDIVGEDWEGLRGGLESLRAEKGMQAVVTLHGGVSEKELRQAYARAQYFVSASSYEGFGISTIEGMAAGCIPIVNRIPTFQSFVGEENAGGTRGLLVDYGSPREAAEQIIAFIGSKPAQLQKNSFCGTSVRRDIFMGLHRPTTTRFL
jgi:alpha-1,3-mannosyltransferase